MAPSSHTILRVFISSPGDVAEERIATMQAVDALSTAPWLPGSVAIKAVAWDRIGSGAPLTATKTPQDAINAGMATPAECDLVIVIFGSRLGSPLPKDYTRPNGTTGLSGTEWELWNAIEGYEKHGLPEVLVYRRATLPDLDPQAPNYQQQAEQRSNLDRFFQQEFLHSDGTWKRGYQSYTDPQDFKQKISGDLEKQLALILEKHQQGIRPGSGQRELAIGQCSACRRVSQDWQKRKRCGHCGGHLVEPCLHCGHDNGIWHSRCASCGSETEPLVQKALKSLQETKEKLPVLWQKGAYGKVLRYLHEKTKHTHPRLQQEAGWAYTAYAEHQKQFAALQQQWKQWEQEAGSCSARNDLILAQQKLEQIPEDHRSPSAQVLLKELQQKHQAIVRIYAELGELESQQQWLQLAARLAELRQLQKNDTRIEQYQQTAATGLRNQLLKDPENIRLRQSYLQARPDNLRSADRDLGLQTEKKLRRGMVITLAIFIVPLLALPVVLRFFKKQKIPEMFERFGPLPWGALRLSAHEIERDYCGMKA